MELKDFVRTVLTDLINAVDEAKHELGENGSQICPSIGHAYAKDFGVHVDSAGKYHQKIEFDVAVTAGEEGNIEGNVAGKAGIIKVLSLSADINGSLKNNNSTVSRVKFHIPVALKPN